MPRTAEMTLIALDYHRNGVAGNGFHVALFDWKDGRKTRRMVATIFGESGNVAVLDTRETAAGNIAFANGNSWRGDEFETWLRLQILNSYPEETLFPMVSDCPHCRVDSLLTSGVTCPKCKSTLCSDCETESRTTGHCPKETECR